MPVQINPSKIPIWISESNLRLGTSPESQVIEQVSNAQERLIQILFEGVATEQVALVGGSVGLSEIETRAFIEQLRPSLIVEAPEVNSRTSIDVRFAELIRIGFQTDQAPMNVIAKRAKTRIRISLLDRTGLNLLKILCELGFRTFETEDYELVGDQDGGELGYPTSLRSVSRVAACKAILELENSKVLIDYPNPKIKASPALKIITATHRLLPSSYQMLDVPFVAIEYRIDSVYVSGVVVAGRTPCLGCRELWHKEEEPNWFGESLQLSARNDHLDDGASVLMATALTARNICNFVDFENAGVGNLVRVGSRSIAEISHQFHPGCACNSKKLKG